MALIFLNRYLDIAEAIEDGLPHMHLEQLQGRNLPGKVPLPQKQSLSATQRAEVSTTFVMDYNALGRSATLLLFLAVEGLWLGYFWWLLCDRCANG